MTLEITLQDKVRNQRILLYYTIYEDAVVTRFAKWINDGTEPIEICRFLSMNMDLPTQEYDVLTLSGAHTEEKTCIDVHCVRIQSRLKAVVERAAHRQPHLSDC